MLEHAKDYLTIHNLFKSRELHYAFARLYAGILVALEHILEWLRKKPWRHAISAGLRQDNYGFVLKEKIHVVSKLSAAVQEQARVCSHWMIGSINEKMSRRQFILSQL